MKLNWLLCAALLLVGTSNIQADEDGDDSDKGDDGDKDAEKLDNMKEDPNASPPEVIYKAPVPKREVYFAENFDKGILAGRVLSKANKEEMDYEIAIYDGKREIQEMKETKLPEDKKRTCTVV